MNMLGEMQKQGRGRSSYIPLHARWRCGLVALPPPSLSYFVRALNKGYKTTNNHSSVAHILVVVTPTLCSCVSKKTRARVALATGNRTAMFVTYSVCASLPQAGGESQEDVIRSFDNEDIGVE